MSQGTDLEKLARDVESTDHAARMAALAGVLHLHDPGVGEVRLLRRLLDALTRVGKSQDAEEIYLARKGQTHVRDLLGQLGAPVEPPPSRLPAPTQTKAEVLAAIERETEPEALSNLTARLAGFTGEDVLETAIALTRHKNGRIRANAVEAIAANAQARRMLVTLVPLLSDPNHRVRANVAKAMAKLGYPMVAGILSEMLGSKETRFRESAMWVASHVGRKENVPLLLKALSDRFQPIQIRAIRGLANHGVTSAMPQLEELARTGEPRVREEAAKAIAILSGKVSPAEELVDLAHLADRTPSRVDPGGED